MRTSIALAAAVVLAAGSAATAQSLSTGFEGTTITSTGTVHSGNMFDVSVENPGGITINSFDIHLSSAAAAQLQVDVYYRTETYVGHSTDPSAWTHLGSAVVDNAGAGSPTPVPIGGLTIPFGGHYGLYVAAAGPVRYSNASLTPSLPVQNDDLSIHINNGIAVDGPFASNSSFGPPRGWNGTIHYTAHGTTVEGACCLPDGTCELMGEISCTNADGTYHGDNTECATIPPCPQPGACCLPEGGCEILSEGQCASINGTYNGNGSACETAGCPGGACCLTDGTCVFTIDSICSFEFNGTYRGDGTACGDERCATLPVLWNNGPIVTAPGLACLGGDLSELETALGTTILGFGWSQPNLAVADQFTIPAGESWTIEDVVMWGYQTQATTVTINEMAVQIWDGEPGQPGSNVVAGDITTNCLTTATFTDIYRASTANMFDCSRRQQEVTCGLNATLGSGTYWLEATVGGDPGFSGPFLPPVKFLSRPSKPFPTGLQRTSAGWGELSEPQAIPFVLSGTVGDECYPDCNDDGILNINDFLCFIDLFAVQDPYADCNNDGAFNINDFLCFIDEFAVGCP